MKFAGPAMSKNNFILIIAYSTFFLLGCSFAKEAQQPAIIAEVKTKPTQLSDLQLKILSAVEQGNLNALQELLPQASVLDYSFAGAEKTPIEIALQNDYFEIIQLLLEKKVDVFNLGSYDEAFQKSAFNYGMSRAFESVGYQEFPKGPLLTFNRSEKLLLSQIWRQARLIVGAAQGSDFGKSKALFLNSKMGCHLFETSTIILNIQNGSYEKMLAALGCQRSTTPTEVRRLYLLTVLRSFQTLFTNVEHLSYLSRSPNLKSTLIYLEDYEVYISPSLLFRISRSAENYAINANYCKILSLDAGDCRKSTRRKTDVRGLFESKNIVFSEYEVVRMHDGYSFKGQRYKELPYRQSSDDEFTLFKFEDPFYASISAVLNGYDNDLNLDKLFQVHDGKATLSSEESILVGEVPGESLQRLDEENRPFFKKRAIPSVPLEDFEIGLN